MNDGSVLVQMETGKATARFTVLCYATCYMGHLMRDRCARLLGRSSLYRYFAVGHDRSDGTRIPDVPRGAGKPRPGGCGWEMCVPWMGQTTNVPVCVGLFGDGA